MTWTVVLTPTARRMLESVSDRRVRAVIVRRIDALAEDPEHQGRPLIAELTGLRSVRPVGQRYRIIYRVENDEVVVLVVAVGLRRKGDRADVYELARRLFRQRLLEPDAEED